MSKFLFHGRNLTIGNITATCFIFFTALILLSGTALAELNIDGRLDEPDWASAQIFSDFVVIEPLTYDTPALKTEARMLSLPEGLAVAFICEQPEETRTRTITRRDPDRFDSDAVTLIIDFDNQGEQVYQFSVSITGSYQDGTLDRKFHLNRDWDGLWQRAVSEDEDRWTVELLLPWSIVAMRNGNDDIRQLRVFFQRDLYATGESFAFPETSTTLSRFISEIAAVEVQRYSSSVFNIWPYATLLNDLVDESTDTKAGLDVFWKPSSNFQVAAAFNPDFGQVESDDLVIDFSAIEVMFSDKRPFFTENQSIFDDALVKNESVFYTRRVGGPKDDHSGVSDIDGAVKVIGSAGILNYGLFAAREADAEDVGRSFYAGRFVLPGANWLVGTQTTYTERPYLNRNALVNSLNYDVKAGEHWRFIGQFISSIVDTDDGDTDGFGSFNAIQYTLNDHWDFEFSLLYYDESLDINDMGYLRRNNLEEWYFSFSHSQTDFPESSRTASVYWRSYAIRPYNMDGVELSNSIMMMRNQKMRSGSEISLRMNYMHEGNDDLISRGNGLVYLKSRFSGGLSYSTPRRGTWRKAIGIDLFQEGYEDWGLGLNTSLTWYPHEKLNIDFSLRPKWSPDWLIWLQGDQLVSFSRNSFSSNMTANWFPADKHEVRLRAQWLTIDAETEQAYRIGPRGRLVPSDDAVNDFAMINFGLQVRYRYEINPLSDFYIVYSRGGLDRIEKPGRNTWDLLGASTGLRNSDQVLVKLRYGF